MSLPNFIVNLTITLKDHVTNGVIDENTMLSILKNVLTNTTNSSITESTNLKCCLFSDYLYNIPTINGIEFYSKKKDCKRVTEIDTPLVKKQSWCDLSSDDDEDFKLPIKKLPLNNNIDDKKMIIYLKNCEKTINFFIDTYKVNHYDSAKTIKELNITVIRLLGINLKDKNPKAYSNTCWFIRNLKCNFGENCQANEHNRCTYAHPKSKLKKKQYCCINEPNYDIWDTTYFKCLKSENFVNNENYFNDNLNLNELIPLQTYDYMNTAIINWYLNIAKLIK